MNRQNNRRNSNNIIVRTNNLPLSFPVRNALRSWRRQDNKSSILVSGPNDPRPIRRDILVTKVVEGGTATLTTGYAYSDIYKLLDAGATPFFTEMRVIGLTAYGSSLTEGNVRITIPADGANYLDHGVAGFKRPVLHVRLPEITRITWVPTTSTTPIVTYAASGLPTLLQFTIEVRGDASGDA